MKTSENFCSKSCQGPASQGWEEALAQQGIEFTHRVLNSACVYYEYDGNAHCFATVKLMPTSIGGVFYAAEQLAKRRQANMMKVMELLQMKMGVLAGHVTEDEYEDAEVRLLGYNSPASWDSYLNLWVDPCTGISIGAPVLSLFLEALPQELLLSFAKALKSQRS